MGERKNKSGLLKELFGTSMFLAIAVFGYLSFEPAITDAADTATDTITVSATVTSDISITSTDNTVALDDEDSIIGGVSGGNANGEAVWTVITSDANGYGVTLKADAANCLQKVGNPDIYFTDYTTTPSFAWTVASGSAFGFTVETVNYAVTADAFKDGGSACGAGTTNTADACWSGFNGTTGIAIAQEAGPTAGTAITVPFRATLASGSFLPEGNYVAHITATATVL